MSEKIPVLVIVGPTASGKTSLAVEMCKRFNGEVVSADSMQIYKDMQIGTAKPTESEKEGIPHHLLDFLNPEESFSVAQYVQMASEKIKDIHSRGKLPVIAGGTGLYINSLIDASLFDAPSQDEELRKELEDYLNKNGAIALHEMLRECDEKAAEKIHPNNTGRVIRAIEVYKVTGKTISQWQSESKNTQSIYRPCMIGLTCKDRQKLYDRINLRVDIMLKDGLLDEVKSFYEKGYSGTAAQAIGYKELYSYLEGNTSLEDAVNILKQQTRRYAKRQLTWFKRDERINWLYRDEDDWQNIIAKSQKIVEDFLMA